MYGLYIVAFGFGFDPSFNRIDKKFFKPMEIKRWIVVIYADSRRFNQGAAEEMVRGLVAGCRSVGKDFFHRSRSRYANIRSLGITIRDEQPLIKWENGQGHIGEVCPSLLLRKFVVLTLE